MSEQVDFIDESGNDWLPPIGNFDSPWKDLIDSHFREFMAFFFPHAGSSRRSASGCLFDALRRRIIHN